MTDVEHKHAKGDEQQWAVEWENGAFFKGWTEAGARDLYLRDPKEYVALHRLDPLTPRGWTWIEVERRRPSSDD